MAHSGHFLILNFTWPVPDEDVKVQLIHLDDREDHEDVAKDNSNAEEEKKQGPIVLLLQRVRCRGEVEVVRKKSGLVEQRKYSLIFRHRSGDSIRRLVRRPDHLCQTHFTAATGSSSVTKTF